MIPNMARTVKRKSIPFTYVSITINNTGFEDVNIKTEHKIKGVIQIPQDETIQALNLDFSLNYRQIHISSDLNVTPKNNDEFKYKGKNYKVVRFRDFSDYGYFEFIGEELLNGGY